MKKLILVISLQVFLITFLVFSQESKPDNQSEITPSQTSGFDESVVKIGGSVEYVKEMEKVFSLVLEKKIGSIKTELEKLPQNLSFAIGLSFIVLGIVAIALLSLIFFSIYQTVVRDLFEETKKMKKENQKKDTDEEMTIFDSLIDDIGFKTDNRNNDQVEELPEIEEPEGIVSHQHSTHKEEPPEELVYETFEMDENAITTLIEFVQQKERDFYSFKNRLFENLMKFVENQLDFARSQFVSFLQQRLIEIDQIDPEKVSLNTSFQIMRLVSSAARPVLLAQIRSFLRFDDIFIQKAGYIDNTLFDDSDIESRIKFLIAKYTEFFQINSIGHIHLSLMDFNRMMEDLKPAFKILLEEIFKKHLEFLKNIREGMKRMDMEIDEKRILLFDNLHRFHKKMV